MFDTAAYRHRIGYDGALDPTPHGRVTLADMRLIVTEHRQRQEQTLAGPAERHAALRTHFGIVLDEPRPSFS